MTLTSKADCFEPQGCCKAGQPEAAWLFRIGAQYTAVHLQVMPMQACTALCTDDLLISCLLDCPSQLSASSPAGQLHGAGCLSTFKHVAWQ